MVSETGESFNVSIQGADDTSWNSGRFCRDTSRPGFYCVAWDYSESLDGSDGHATRVFRFTDLRTAMEFRIYSQQKAR